MTCEAIANRYKRKPMVGVEAVLGALEELGMVRKLETGKYQLAA